VSTGVSLYRQHRSTMPSSFWRRRPSTTRQPSSSTADEEQQRQHYSTADSRPSGGNASPENDDSTPRSSPRTSRIIQGFLKRTRTLKRGANEPESAVLQKRPNLNLKVSAHTSPVSPPFHPPSTSVSPCKPAVQVPPFLWLHRGSQSRMILALPAPPCDVFHCT